MKIMNLADHLIEQRHQILSSILGNKKMCLLFSRDVQYLAIAIIDKFLLSESSCQCNVDEFKQACYYSIAALLIAFKFLRNDGFGLKQVFALIKNSEQIGKKFQILQIIQTEEEILQRIEFQIPQTTSYVILQNFLNSENVSPARKQMQIKTTMKLLKEITLISFEPSLCPEMGKQLYRLIESKNSTQRIKKLYKLACSSLRQKNSVLS